MTKLTSIPLKKPAEHDEMKSGYVRERRNNHEEMLRRLSSYDYDNRLFMRSFDLDRISYILDSIGHFERHR